MPGRVALLLFCSGLGSLLLQVGWMREFRLVFGGSAAASAAVVAIFMGGLGVGSAWLGARADRATVPLRLYALLEFGIFVSAALSPVGVALVARAYVALGGQSALGFAGATGVRLLGAAVVLAVPTILMGGTLPTAVRAVVHEQDRQRRWVAILYGLNTLGAVCGASLGTFWLLAALGTRGTIWAASAVELAVAVLAWNGARRAPAGGAAPARSGSPPQSRARARARRNMPSSASAPVATPPVQPALIYAASASVGFAFFLMELVWYRMLGPILGGTTYTFGLLLAVALLGIGLGGASYAVVFQRRRPSLGTFALTCGGEAVCVAIPFALGDQLALQAALWAETSATFLQQVMSWTAIALIVVFPAALVSGLQYPILVSLLGEGEERIGRQVGWCGAWNTIGAIAGSLCGGFGALPLLSAPGAWRLVALLLAVVGLGAAILALRGQPRPWRRLALPAVLSAAAFSLITYEGPTAVWRHSGIGAGRVTLPADRTPNRMRDWSHGRRRRLLWETDGVEASIGLVTDNALSFYVNGKCDGNALDDAGTQIMLGILPALLHPSPSSGLVVGLGTGESAGWLAEVDSVKQVDVVELEPAVDEMAQRCAAVNFHVLEHPKVRRLYADAREVLMTVRQRYDVIVSEPSNPYRAGVANLFTREFYTAAHNALQPGGLFVQWLQAYEVDVPTVRTVLATLRSVFGSVEVWQSQRGDLLLVCGAEMRPLPVESLRDKIRRAPFRSALAFAWRVTDLEGVCSRYVADSGLVERWSHWPHQTPNTDDRNRVEYGFARTVGAEAGFAVSVLAQEAEAAGAARPRTTDGDIDWERVRDHRQVFAATWHGDTSVPGDASPDQRVRARFLQAYFDAAATREMVAIWEATPYAAVFPSEVALLALAYADVADDRAVPLAQQLASYYPAEAAAIITLTRWRQGDVAASVAALEETCAALRAQPWGMSHAIELTFLVAEELARQSPAWASRVYAALSAPFAVYAYEQERITTAHGVAYHLGRDALLETVALFEPWIPWTEPFLAARSEIYARAGHPLSAQAQRDLQAFRRAAR